MRRSPLDSSSRSPTSGFGSMHEPRLARCAQDVPAVEVLVHEQRRGAVDRAVDVERGVEQLALERRAGGRVPARHVVGPAVGLGREQRERVSPRRPATCSRGRSWAITCDLVDIGASRAAVPGTQRSIGVARDARRRGRAGAPRHRPPHSVERVGLGVSLAMGRRVQLEHELACGNDERVRRVDRVLAARATTAPHTRQRAAAARRCQSGSWLHVALSVGRDGRTRGSVGRTT